MDVCFSKKCTYFNLFKAMTIFTFLGWLLRLSSINTVQICQVRID